MQKFFITLFFCFSVIIGFCQKENEPTSPAQSVFLEIGGNGLLFSANYDVRFTPHQNGIGGRIGLGFFGGSGGGILTVPIGLNYLAGKAPNFLEAGLGYTYATFTGQDEFFSGHGGLLFPSIGYRYQQAGNGLMARIVISPAIEFGEGGGWAFFGGIGVGYKF
ncbi:MAG TPA: hypothetical protein VHB70_00935 [Parafilimonas sp.]|nr:hypothetical protein [Parafilimonas sp.]